MFILGGGGGGGGRELGRKAWQGVYEYKPVFLYLPIYVSSLLVAVNFFMLVTREPRTP